MSSVVFLFFLVCQSSTVALYILYTVYILRFLNTKGLSSPNAFVGLVGPPYFFCKAIRGICSTILHRTLLEARWASSEMEERFRLQRAEQLEEERRARLSVLAGQSCGPLWAL